MVDVHVHASCLCWTSMFLSMFMPHIIGVCACASACSCACSCSCVLMPECRTVRHPNSPVPDWKKLTMLEQVRYRTQLTQSSIFLVRYRTKIRDAGMPMPSYVYIITPAAAYTSYSGSCVYIILRQLRIHHTPAAAYTSYSGSCVYIILRQLRIHHTPAAGCAQHCTMYSYL